MNQSQPETELDTGDAAALEFLNKRDEEREAA